MKIAVVGAGYVGLVTAACLAELGNDVMCIDKDHGRVALLQAGGVPAVMKELLKAGILHGGGHGVQNGLRRSRRIRTVAVVPVLVRVVVAR